MRFVGAGDAFGSGGRFRACILLHAPRHDRGDVLLDGGASSLVELAHGADLLIAEGCTYQRKIRFHLDVATLQQHAGRLAARRVILTHLSAEVLARAGELGWETAHDAMTVDLPAVRP